ncbi:MAG: glycosyltransferase family 4 protein [Patescibacteria group bacterium]
MPRLHILVFSLAYRPYVGGAEIALEEIMRRLPQYFFTVVTARAMKNFDYVKLPDIEEKDNVRVVRVGSRNRYLGQYAYPLAALKHAYREARFSKPACVWGMLESYGGIAAALYHQRFPNMPYILTMQSGDSESFWGWRTWFWQPLYKKVFSQANAIQAISKYLAERAKKYGARGEIRIIPNGVDSVFFERISDEERRRLRQELGLSDDETVVITASRLVSKNGIDTLIKGFSVWRQRGGNGVLLILGKGPQETELRKLSYKLGINTQVKFLGEIPYQELPKYYGAADIFIRPSRSEGLGNAFLEAMASGIPVIGTPVGGIPDFLTHERTGLMVPPDDPEALKDSIARLCSNPELKQKLIQEARKLALEKYSWDVVAHAMNNLFQNYVKIS